jgi:4-amino-4-deoxy-L-arabinose transferase-like glycosyltransferase
MSRSGGFPAADLDRQQLGKRRSLILLAIVGTVGAVLLLVTNLPWQLDDYDQAKQAFTSFEMIKEGHWLYQHTPHGRVATKPPFIGWVSAGVFAITRSWAVAWRLPSFLAALAISILLFRAATLAHGSIAGFIASSAFVFNLLTPRLATLVRTDMPLALAVFLIGLLIWQKVRRNEPWNTRDRFSIFALLTGAMLIKGPIVYAFLLPGIIAFAIIRPRPAFATLRRGQNGGHYSAWPGWWPWLASLGIFLLWVIGGIRFEHGFFEQVVVREFLGRFGTTVHQPKELLFYLPHLLHKLFPWSLAMIAFAVMDLRSRRWNIRAAFHDLSAETVWLGCWIFGGLIVMSIIPSKRVDRIFPIVAPLCLLLAAQVNKIAMSCSHGAMSPYTVSDEPRAARRSEAATKNGIMATRFLRWSFIALLVAILSTSGYAVTKVVSGYRGNRDALVRFGRAVRDEAAAHHWRYEVLKTADEGLLLYLEKTHFLGPQQATVEWNAENLDALVVPAQEAPALMSELRGVALAGLRSSGRKEDGTSYVLIIH